MKNILILLVLLASYHLGAQINLPSDYKTLEITGTMNSLLINGVDGKESTLLIESSSNEQKSDWTQKSTKNKLKLHFNDSEVGVVINLPKDKNLDIKTDDIVFEGMFDVEKDQRLIAIENMIGTINVSTDGYMVNLKKNKNDMSVVSYLDIFADSMRINNDASIMFDSYWGDVTLRAIPPLDAAINMRAKLGEVYLDSMISITKEITLLNDKISVITGEGLGDILLHSERGNSALLDLESSMKLVEEEIARISDHNNGFSDGFTVSQNTPNPWTDNTTINFDLAKAEKVTFTFFDLKGNILYELDKEGLKGKNTLTVTDKMLPKTGVIYFTIKTDSGQKSRKMVHVEK